jgi:hypothetical protein
MAVRRRNSKRKRRAKPRAEFVRASCIVCGDETIDDVPKLGARTCDGFRVEHPVCGDGRYLICADCESPGCIICGCKLLLDVDAPPPRPEFVSWQQIVEEVDDEP